MSTIGNWLIASYLLAFGTIFCGYWSITATQLALHSTSTLDLCINAFGALGFVGLAIPSTICATIMIHEMTKRIR